MGGIPCGRNPVGGIPRGRNPVWEESHGGGIPWEESRGRNSAWEESRWNPFFNVGGPRGHFFYQKTLENVEINDLLDITVYR